MKKIVIIGGGIAGLSAGIYAQINGFNSIFRKNAMTGGECIGWEREGCYIDGCIHWLTGSNSGDLNKIWNRVGALENVHIIEPEYFYRYKNEAIEISIYRDLEKLKTELLNFASEDFNQIIEFIGYIEAMQKMSMPLEPLDQMKIFELMKLGKSMMKLRKTLKVINSISIGEYANQCKSEIFKKFLLSYMPENYQLMSLIISIATFVSGNNNIPEGSSMDFSNRMKDKYLSLGGKIELNTTVSSVVITNKIIKKVLIVIMLFRLVMRI